MTTVVVVDDHPTFRAGLRGVLAAAGLEVLAEAIDADTAESVVAEFRPDVVVMDLLMPGVGGVEATRRILARHPPTGVVVLTMSSADEAVYAALRAGARGYLLKDAEAEEIVAAVRGAAAGRATFSAAVTPTVLGHFAGVAAPAAFADLTDREREVLELVAQGCDNAAIARTLRISTKTARNYVSNVLTKLHVADRPQAIVKAREHGFGRTGR